MNDNHDKLCLSLALATILGGIAQAQEPTRGHVAPEPVSIIRQAHGLGFTDGALVGGGADYRIEFMTDRVRYTPALGHRAPRSMPLDLALESIARGGTSLGSTEDGYDYEAPTIDGNSVLFERLDGVIERYRVGPVGTELSFVFPRPLPGDGDLIVVMTLETDLEPVDSGDGGLRFDAGDGLGAVHVGEVTGIDAAGDTVAGGIAFVDGRLELRLPAAFVAEASYPLVLDPLIGTDFDINSDTSNWNDTDVDAAYDADSDMYLVAWERSFSMENVEVRAQRVTYAGVLVGGFYSLTNYSTPTISINPTVGNVNETDMFLVAWQTGPSPFGPFDIQCRSVSPAGSLSSIVPIAYTPTLNEVDPDLANDPETGSDHDEAILVWTEEGTGIRSMQVTVPPVPGDPIAMSIQAISADPGDRDAAISKGGGFDRHLVVWVRESGTQQSVHARFVNKNGSGMTSEGTAYPTSSWGPDKPDVDGDGTDFLLVFHRRQSSSSSAYRNVVGRMVHFDSGRMAFVTPTTTLEGSSSTDERDPAVGFLGDRYILAWSESTATPMDYDIGTKFIAPQGCGACGSEVNLDGTNDYDRDPAIATTYSSGERSGLRADYGLIVFASHDLTPPLEGDVLGQRVQAIGVGGSASNLGGGCGLRGSISRSGALVPGSPDFRIQLSNVPGALGGVLSVDTSPPGLSPITCGSCTVIQGFATVFPSVFDPIAGTAYVPIPLPCVASLIGEAFEFQWLFVAVGWDPCPIVASISASDRLRIVIGE